MSKTKRPLAVVTGASTGIGYELARCCAENDFDLIVAADEVEIENAAAHFRDIGAKVEAIKADLATIEALICSVPPRKAGNSTPCLPTPGFRSGLPMTSSALSTPT